MERTITTNSKQTAKALRFGLHLLALICLLVAAIALATVSGDLWPFDLRFSALITGAGLAMLAIAWWPAALAFAVISALLPRALWRLAFWPLAVSVMMAIHWGFGTALGFMPLGALGLAGALKLYTIPTAVPILFGSALREGLA